MNTALLNVGFNWDPQLARDLVKMNSEIGDDYQTRIASVYGSTRGNPIGTARPIDRIPKVGMREWVECARILSDGGILINLTLNPPCLGDLERFHDEEELSVMEQWLFDVWRNGLASKVTVAHPLVLELVQRVNERGAKLAIEISTILNVDTLGHFVYYGKVQGVESICLAIGRNRDFGFLRSLGTSITNGSEGHLPQVELLVNEFCSIGGINCAGIHRAACYNAHAHNVFNKCENYPMSRCTVSRWQHPASWLKARFILPQWMEIYQNDARINRFKISGRTHPSEYIRDVVRSYMRRQYTGNLLGLWAQLESIWQGPDGQTEVIGKQPYTLRCDDPLVNSLIHHWSRNPSLRCAEKFCGSSCRYCDSIFADITGMKEDPK